MSAPRPCDLLFDLDGTLTDSRPGILESIRAAFRQMGLEPPTVESMEPWFWGPPMHQTMPRLLGTNDPVRVARAIDLFRAHYTAGGLLDGNRVYEGVEAALDELRARGHRLFVATSKPEPFALRVLEHFGLRPRFAGVCGSNLDGSRGRKDVVIRWLISQHAIDPSEAVMIGDREHDLIGARETGMAACGVTWGYGSREELLAQNPRHVVDRPRDWLGIFG